MAERRSPKPKVEGSIPSAPATTVNRHFHQWRPIVGFMSNTNVETVNRGPDRVKLGLAIFVLAAGIVGYSVLETQPGIVRVGVFLASVILAAFIAWTSHTGKRAVGYVKDSYTEVKRVHWPSRKEATQMTAIVFAFVTLMAILLWFIDKGLEWVIYGLLLGWK